MIYVALFTGMAAILDFSHHIGISKVGPMLTLYSFLKKVYFYSLTKMTGLK
jgi:hypothetical protein